MTKRVLSLVLLVCVFGASLARRNQPPIPPDPIVPAPVIPDPTLPAPVIPPPAGPLVNNVNHTSIGARSIQQSCDELFAALQRHDFDAIKKVIADRSIVHVSSILPAGGRYRSELGIASLLDRLTQFMKITNLSYNTLVADPLTGKSITTVALTGEFLRTQVTMSAVNLSSLASQPMRPGYPIHPVPVEPAPPVPPRTNQNPATPVPVLQAGQALTLNLHVVIDWFSNGTLKYASIIPLNDLHVHEQTRFRSQLVLHNMFTKIYQGRAEGDKKKFEIGSLNEFIHDNVILTLHNFAGPHILPKTIFTGLNEIHQFFMSLKENVKETECTEVLLNDLCGGTAKLLHADDQNVVYLYMLGGQSSEHYFPKYVVASFAINEQGKLSKVDAIASRPLLPFQIVLNKPLFPSGGN